MPSGTYILLGSFVHRLQQEKCYLCKTRVAFRAVKHWHFLPLCSWSVDCFDNKRDGSRKGDTCLCGTDEFWEDGPHSVPCVTAPSSIWQESGTAGSTNFSDLCNRFFLQASDFHLCLFHHQNHSSPLQGEIIWLGSLQCQAEGCWTKGDKCSYYNRESSFPMIFFSVVAGSPRLSKCYSVS